MDPTIRLLYFVADHHVLHNPGAENSAAWANIKRTIRRENPAITAISVDLARSWYEFLKSAKWPRGMRQQIRIIMSVFECILQISIYDDDYDEMVAF
jgi:hypothetical protein